jgi:hypothetical protein
MLSGSKAEAAKILSRRHMTLRDKALSHLNVFVRAIAGSGLKVTAG